MILLLLLEVEKILHRSGVEDQDGSITVNTLGVGVGVGGGVGWG